MGHAKYRESAPRVLDLAATSVPTFLTIYMGHSVNEYFVCFTELMEFSVNEKIV